MKYKIILHNLTKAQAELIKECLDSKYKPEIQNDWLAPSE